MNINPLANLTGTKASATIQERIAQAVAPAKLDREAVFLPSGKVLMVDGPSYRARLAALEAEGMTTSDAQGCADAEFIAAARGKRTLAAISDVMNPGPARDAQNARLVGAAIAASLGTPPETIEAVAAAMQSPTGEPHDAHVKTLHAAAHDAFVEVVGAVAAALESAPQAETPTATGESAATALMKHMEDHAAAQEIVALANKAPEKRKVGRPKKPDALSGKERQARTVAKVKSEGGKRTTMNISPGAAKRIAEIRAACGFAHERDAVEFAILNVKVPK